jgi:hypothetical protein
VIARVARKPHRCVAADPAKGTGASVRPNYRPDCLQDINPGDVYGEYVGEAAFAESGRPYCQQCAAAVWSRSEWEQQRN